MEGGKAPASSSSSSSSSSKETKTSLSSVNGSSLAAKGIFNSVFPPPVTILGRNSLNFDALGSLRKHESEFQAERTKHSADLEQSSKSQRSVPGKDMSSIYSDQAVEPCFLNLSSSIHYGGRDHYVQSSNARDSPHKNENEVEGDDKNIASRGNWWQGSLYY